MGAFVQYQLEQAGGPGLPAQPWLRETPSQAETKCCLHRKTGCGSTFPMPVLSTEETGEFSWGGVQTFCSLHTSPSYSWHFGGRFVFSFMNQNKRKKWKVMVFQRGERKRERKRLIISFIIFLQCFLFDLCPSK